MVSRTTQQLLAEEADFLTLWKDWIMQSAIDLIPRYIRPCVAICVWCPAEQLTMILVTKESLTQDCDSRSLCSDIHKCMFQAEAGIPITERYELCTSICSGKVCIIAQVGVWVGRSHHKRVVHQLTVYSGESGHINTNRWKQNLIGGGLAVVFITIHQGLWVPYIHFLQADLFKTTAVHYTYMSGAKSCWKLPGCLVSLSLLCSRARQLWMSDTNELLWFKEMWRQLLGRVKKSVLKSCSAP